MNFPLIFLNSLFLVLLATLLIGIWLFLWP